NKCLVFNIVKCLRVITKEPAVYGQSEIHKKVMALSFRDCHTKIRHVDAHATLNEGVVVQVLGELSNNMQPMRKFMQTFVLAPEIAKSDVFFRLTLMNCSPPDQ
uniref:NTF2 domain-containing protein n=1 Tax=Sinocyclocheilus grahami TaxID=75366 RepID=A0A672KJ94_SINGR